MGFKSFSSFQKSTEKPKEEKTAPEIKPSTKQESFEASQKSEIYKRARTGLGAICEEFDEPNERTAEIMKKVEQFFQHIDKKILPNEKIEEMRKSLEACSLVQDKGEFLELVMKILKPALDIKEAHADKFEEA